MIETYRLFELTAFLSLAKIVPEDSVADIDVIVDEDVFENEVHSTETYQNSCLNDEEFESLKQFYKYSTNQEPVTVKETALENTITIRRYLVKSDRYGRHIRYSPYSPSSKHSSCILYMCKSCSGRNQIIFGEIKKTFLHKFHGHTNFLVYVHWYKQFYKDTSSKLIVINTSETASLNPIANIHDLSTPLVHSYDTEEEGKLWILNARID